MRYTHTLLYYIKLYNHYIIQIHATHFIVCEIASMLPFAIHFKLTSTCELPGCIAQERMCNVASQTKIAATVQSAPLPGDTIWLRPTTSSNTVAPPLIIHRWKQLIHTLAYVIICTALSSSNIRNNSSFYDLPVKSW